MTRTSVSHTDLVNASAIAVRSAIRDGSYAGHTASLAAGKLQCNLAILPENMHWISYVSVCAIPSLAQSSVVSKAAQVASFCEDGQGVDRADPRY